MSQPGERVEETWQGFEKSGVKEVFSNEYGLENVTGSKYHENVVKAKHGRVSVVPVTRSRGQKSAVSEQEKY